MLVKDVIAAYLANLAQRVKDDDYSEMGHTNAVRDLERFAAKYGQQTIAECKQHNMSEFLLSNPQFVAMNTKQRVVSTILACFNFALEEELIERNPYRRPKGVRGKPCRARRPTEVWEYVKLMRFGSRPLRRGLFILRRTGMRVSEMRDLTWPDVRDLDGPSPHLVLPRHKSIRKTGKPRLVGLDPSTARFLRNLRRQWERFQGCNCPHCREVLTDRVFTNSDGGPWDRHTFGRHLRRTAQKLGMDGAGENVVAYGLRHLFAVTGIEAGIGVRQLADQLGHSDSKMVDKIYGSSTRHKPEHLANVANQVNASRRRKGKDGAG